MLTPKQEAFAQAVALEGMTQSDAYRTAYSCKSMSDKTVCENASRLMANSNIAARVSELRATLVSPKIMSAQERLEWLTQLIQSENETTSDKLRATDIMNKMQGEYVQKVETEIKNAVTINIELSDD